MILVTVGTEKFPFDRLVKTIDKARGEGRILKKVFIQKGNSTYIPKWAEYVDFLDYEQMIELVKEADIIVSHAGVGSLLLCWELEKIPIIFPRRADFGEHLDDHQMELAKAMDRLSKAIVAYDEKGLLRKINIYAFLAGRIKKKENPTRSAIITYIKKIIRGA